MRVDGCLHIDSSHFTGTLDVGVKSCSRQQVTVGSSRGVSLAVAISICLLRGHVCAPAQDGRLRERRVHGGYQLGFDQVQNGDIK